MGGYRPYVLAGERDWLLQQLAEQPDVTGTPVSRIGPSWRAGGRGGRSNQGRIDPSRLVFIDEGCARTNMTRIHGRVSRGCRLVAKAPHGRWRTLTFLAALRHDRLEATCVFDGPLNGELFLACSFWCRR